jgi:hypothetical protein
MGPHRKMRIYVGYESQSIIKYLEPKTGDLFTARYADSIFDEDWFLALRGGLYLKTKDAGKLNGMLVAFIHLSHALKTLNLKFKE